MLFVIKSLSVLKQTEVTVVAFKKVYFRSQKRSVSPLCVSVTVFSVEIIGFLTRVVENNH